MTLPTETGPAAAPDRLSVRPVEGERFTKADLDTATSRSTGALAQSLIRLIADNLIYRDDHGVYAYTAPMFGDFMRRPTPASRRGRVTRPHEALFTLPGLRPANTGDLALRRRGRDSNSRYAYQTHNGFRDRRIQPLCHLSRATSGRLDHPAPRGEELGRAR